jgi:uncharacterized membrane protein
MKCATSSLCSRLFAVGGPLLSAICFAAPAPTFSVQVLTNFSGGTDAYVSGINSVGEAVGSVGSGSAVCPNECAVTWRDGTPSLLATVEGAFATEAYGVNDAGQVVGNIYMTNYDQSMAAMWNNGTLTLLPAPDSQYTSTGTASINDAGQVAGNASDASGSDSVPIVWNGLIPTVLGGVPACTGGGYASGINRNGLIVGTLFCDHGLAPEPVVWKGIVATLLPIKPTAGAPSGDAYAVNDLGLIVGFSNDAANPDLAPSEATAWANGVATNLGPFPTKEGESTANAVNKQGIIVGKSNWFNNTFDHAALWSRIDAAPQDLNSLISTQVAAEITLTEAMGINDRCTIVANGYNKKTGAKEAFLLALTDPSSCVNGL